MVEVVPHDCRCVVEQTGYIVVALAVLDDLGQQLDIVSPASLDELLPNRRSLTSVSRCRSRAVNPVWCTSKASAMAGCCKIGDCRGGDARVDWTTKRE